MRSSIYSAGSTYHIEPTYEFDPLARHQRVKGDDGAASEWPNHDRVPLKEQRDLSGGVELGP